MLSRPLHGPLPPSPTPAPTSLIRAGTVGVPPSCRIRESPVLLRVFFYWGRGHLKRGGGADLLLFKLEAAHTQTLRPPPSAPLTHPALSIRNLWRMKAKILQECMREGTGQSISHGAVSSVVVKTSHDKAWGAPISGFPPRESTHGLPLI